MAKEKNLKRKIGPKTKKVLLLLAAGVTLAISHRPDKAFKIIEGIAKEWEAINARTLREAIKNLYKSKMIGYQEKGGGVVMITLSENGTKKILEYNIDNIQITKPAKWDKLWRTVIFDIPEHSRQGRNALSEKLRELGFYPLQKSVFVHPYECKDEIDFITEVFELKPYVRYLVVKGTDIDLELKTKFDLL